MCKARGRHVPVWWTWTVTLFPCIWPLWGGAPQGLLDKPSASSSTQVPATRKVRYTVVPGWPSVPPDVQLGAVSAVAVSKDGRVLILHRGRHPVLCFDSSGKLLKWWGDGIISELGHGLRIDPAGFVWVTDLIHQQVYKFTIDGELMLALGTKDSPGDRVDQFNQPTDVAVTKAGDIYVSDGYGNARILKFDRNGKLIRIWGREGTEAGEFHTPHAICLDSQERLFVSDRENFRIQIFNSDGKFLSLVQNGLPAFDGLYCAPDDTLFASFGRGNEIFRVTQDGKVLESFGGPHSTEEEVRNNVRVPPGRFNVIHSVALDAEGNVYAAEVRARRVQKIMRVVTTDSEASRKSSN